MKTLPSESRPRRTVRKVSKPQMEKRRRDRINHSLEKLRLLMADGTHDEATRLNMKNPKVGKAEILESVVQFLKTDKGGQPTEPRPTEPSPTRASGDRYREGMESCMLRVSRFIATKELTGPGGDAGQARPSPSVSARGPLIPAPPGLTQQNRSGHSYLSQVNDPHRMAAPSPPSGPWRPWPQ
ncbi:hairy-related 5 [Brachionichthys hirsutus]|uniref:hairy-related 5 n=1 Tax=Brachionichthys hirsutus TaxID=412623 RepID=UPI003604455D